MTERATCETCRWWGKFAWRDVIGPQHWCEWPAPPHLYMRNATRPGASGCVVHQPREVENG